MFEALPPEMFIIMKKGWGPYLVVTLVTKFSIRNTGDEIFGMTSVEYRVTHISKFFKTWN